MVVDGKKIEITIPDVDAMSDTDIEAFVFARDGRWSSQTKSLLRQYETDRLNLNRGWASTTPGWICPCCARGKRQIVRMASSGVLLCQLESHHDHLGDAAEALFRKTNPGTEDKGTNIQLDQAKHAMLTLVERFPRTIICLDCNLVEGKAKSALLGRGVPAHFSFSPQEIARFVQPSDNRPHEFDVDVAAAIWEDVKADVEDRLDFAARMASRVSKGKNRRQPDIGERVSFEFVSRATVIERVLSNADEGRVLWDIGRQLLARSLARDAVGQSKRSKTKPATRAPTDEEFQQINARLNGKHWSLAAEDWTCRCCQRSKRDICRISKKGKWTASIHALREWKFDSGYDDDGPWFDGEIEDRVIVDHRVVLVCQDCRHIITEIQKRDATLSEDALTIADMIECTLDVTSNRMHEVDYDGAIERARMNGDLVRAVASYRELESLARSYYGSVKAFSISNRCSFDQAVDHFVYEHSQQFNVDTDEAAENVRWWIEKGRHFMELD